MSLEDFTALLGGRVPVPVTYTPDAAVERALRQSDFPVERIPRPGADLIARVGVAQYLQGLTISSAALDANYLRRSDAEIFFAPKAGRAPE